MEPNAQKFNGIIDEVMLWDRALTEKEIEFSMDPSSADIEASGNLQRLGNELRGSIRFHTFQIIL